MPPPFLQTLTSLSASAHPRVRPFLTRRLHLVLVELTCDWGFIRPQGWFLHPRELWGEPVRSCSCFHPTQLPGSP